MLSQLSIRDFAIIENAVIEFDGALNVITGETGAGKSIIVDALSMALGGRASKEAIRQGSEKTVIQAIFDIDRSAAVVEQMAELGIDAENQLIFTRQIFANGKNICRINSMAVTVADLRKLGSMLVDIHGQHEHQSLLKISTHIKYLDAFDRAISPAREATRAAYEVYMLAKSALEEVQRLVSQAQQQREELRAEVDEINALELKVGDDEEVERRIVRGRNFSLIADNVQASYAALYAEEQNALKIIQQAFSFLSKAAEADKSLEEPVQSMQSAFIGLEDTALALRDYIADMDFDGEDIDTLEERAYKITQLKRKFAPTIEEILFLRDEKIRALDTLENLDGVLAEKQEAEKEAKEIYYRQAGALSKMRVAAKSRLEQQIEAHLTDLAMPAAVFEVDIKRAPEEGEIRQNGYDDVEFLFSANSGYAPRPLNKIVSGGEMSRLMLALKVLIADEEIATLVFDEIDTGISGRTAQKTAEKLKRLGRQYQVLLITHLPQIAAVAGTHFSARKTMGQLSHTSLIKLDEAARIEELAKMMGGKDITQSTLAHAAQMLQMAKNIE